jgi:rhodanese-related sulfurtransferase
VLIPLGELPARSDELPAQRPLVVVCHHGNRSWYAAVMLEQAGFADVHNLRGGVEAWATEVDPTMKRY